MIRSVPSWRPCGDKCPYVVFDQHTYFIKCLSGPGGSPGEGDPQISWWISEIRVLIFLSPQKKTVNGSRTKPEDSFVGLVVLTNSNISSYRERRLMRRNNNLQHAFTFTTKLLVLVPQHHQTVMIP